eukprot:1351190-Rhodomonas_salina.1
MIARAYAGGRVQRAQAHSPPLCAYWGWRREGETWIRGPRRGHSGASRERRCACNRHTRAQYRTSRILRG